MDKHKKRKTPSLKIRLNRYLAQAGVCSRRKADEFILQGKVRVNGEVITELGHQVSEKDDVRFEGRRIQVQRKIYIILNKPTGVLTTTSDPEGRKTVMELLPEFNAMGIFPVGRLDMNTSGLLLITNDGELSQSLAHPSFEVRKTYQVTLTSPLSDEEIEKIRQGIVLEDGPAKVDEIEFVNKQKKPKKVQLVIHSGKNRLVRRIFEAMGHHVSKLDRISYAQLSLKGLDRGKWRFLSEEEVEKLKRGDAFSFEKTKKKKFSTKRRSSSNVSPASGEKEDGSRKQSPESAYFPKKEQREGKSEKKVNSSDSSQFKKEKFSKKKLDSIRRKERFQKKKEDSSDFKKERPSKKGDGSSPRKEGFSRKKEGSSDFKKERAYKKEDGSSPRKEGFSRKKEGSSDFKKERASKKKDGSSSKKEGFSRKKEGSSDSRKERSAKKGDGSDFKKGKSPYKSPKPPHSSPPGKGIKKKQTKK